MSRLLLEVSFAASVARHELTTERGLFCSLSLRRANYSKRSLLRANYSKRSLLQPQPQSRGRANYKRGDEELTTKEARKS
jgi:hypothetical protein